MVGSQRRSGELMDVSLLERRAHHNRMGTGVGMMRGSPCGILEPQSQMWSLEWSACFLHPWEPQKVSQGRSRARWLRDLWLTRAPSSADSADTCRLPGNQAGGRG